MRRLVPWPFWIPIFLSNDTTCKNLSDLYMDCDCLKKSRKVARQTVPTVHNGIFECALEEQQLWGKVGERGWNTVPWGAVSDVLVTTDEPSSQPSTHQPEISHTGPQLEKCHWCTLTYIWRNELHYLFTHSSSSLVFKRLRGSWISFCTKGFSELL